MSRYLFICFSWVLLLGNASGQEMIRANSLKDHVVERLQIKTGIYPKSHTALRNLWGPEVLQWTEKMQTYEGVLSRADQQNLRRLTEEQIPFSESDSLKALYRNPHPFWGTFYPYPGYLINFSGKDFEITANPVLFASIGKDFTNDQLLFRNTRGILISGRLSENWYFFSSLYENQQNFPGFIDQTIRERRAVPGEGLYKSYQSGVLDDLKGYDFLNASAWVGAKINRFSSFQFGHGRFFVGNGYRSLLLSDYSHNYLFLALDSRVGDFQYKQWFAEMTALPGSFVQGDNLVPKKYMAAHYLSYRPVPGIEAGIFETVIFSRTNHFELQYLNPVILYRTVEHFLGSPDNVLIGINARADIFHTVRLYGQLLLDEFKLNQLLSGEGWWGNKYGLQLGLKYPDLAGIPQLDLQAEWNYVRPFTYGHRDSLTSYSHYHQPLAHPLGANFQEWLVQLKYQPHPSIFLNFDVLFNRYGKDEKGVYYGADILRSSDSRVSDYGHVTGQGEAHQLQQYRFEMSYQFYNNCYWDLSLLYRSDKNILTGETLLYPILGTALRINMDRINLDY